MFQVEKRDGKLVSFDINKIKAAIKKAFSSLKLDTDDSIIDLLALRVTSDFQDKIKNHAIQVEEIQDSVEKILSETGYYHVFLRPALDPQRYQDLHGKWWACPLQYPCTFGI